MTLQKLTAVSTQTLSLLLERQRLQGLTSPGRTTANSLHLPQITRNLKQLRTGIIDLQASEGPSEATTLLINQYERMKNMLGVDGKDFESIPEPAPPNSAGTTSPANSSPPSSKPQQIPAADNDLVYARYKDDPELGYEDEGIMLQAQRRLMDEQDGHLDRLSNSINRQRDISLQINDELDVHTGLLQELDTDLDHTESRLSRARRGLDRVAQGTKENGSTVTIGVLILLLLILIIAFKT